jgi:hypothetical protein
MTAPQEADPPAPPTRLRLKNGDLQLVLNITVLAMLAGFFFRAGSVVKTLDSLEEHVAGIDKSMSALVISDAATTRDVAHLRTRLDTFEQRLGALERKR